MLLLSHQFCWTNSFLTLTGTGNENIPSVNRWRDTVGMATVCATYPHLEVIYMIQLSILLIAMIFPEPYARPKTLQVSLSVLIEK